MITQTTEFEPFIVQDGEHLNNIFIGRGMRRLKRETLSIEDYLKLLRGEGDLIKTWVAGTYEEEDLVYYNTKVWYANIETTGEPGVSLDWIEPTINLETNTISFKTLTGLKTLYWDENENTLALTLNADVDLPLGQKILINVRNSGVDTILKGTPLMESGSVGNSGRIVATLMDGTNPANAMRYIGIASQDILPGEDGFCTDFGKIKNIDTSAYTDGTILYLSTTTLGALVNVAPDNGFLNIPTAYVIHAHTNGSMMVRVSNLDLNLYQPRDASLIALTRADRYLATQDIADMFYDINGNLIKIQYTNPTDVNYEVLNYTDGSLTSVNHYIDSILIGTTTLTYVAGVLRSTIFVLV